MALRLEIFEPIHRSEPGVVEQDVDLTIDIQGGLDHDLDPGDLADIHRNGDGLASLLLDLCRKVLQFLEPACCQHHLAAFRREQTRRVFTKSR